jgi:hypothetical protein
MSAVPPSASPNLVPPADPGLLARQPILWLLIVLALALGLRVAKLTEPLEREEFGAVYAIAERKTQSPEAPPTKKVPLLPVAGLGEVSDRSVLPFGVRNPLPLYHDLLFFTIKALPITEWSLRLPSLLAGLGCVVAIYFLCRRLVGVEMALIAALFVAVEPVQIMLSALARPFALGNLACVLSFAALLGMLNAASPAKALWMAVGYGAAVAFMGYMNLVLLLVVAAHLALLVYWAASHREKVGQVAFGLGGLLVAAVLLAPEYGYLARLQDFSSSHRAEMIRLAPMELRGFLLHNSTFLVGLFVAAVAGLIVRYQAHAGEELPAGSAGGEGTAVAAKQAEADPILAYAASRGDAPGTTAVADATASKPTPTPAEPPSPDNPDAVWTGRLWLLLPQLAAMVVAYTAGEMIFFSRYLSYTTLGGVLVLAYWVTRNPTSQGRLGSAAAVAAAIFGMTFIPSWGHGHGVTTPSTAKEMVDAIDMLATPKPDRPPSLRPGDVVLLRANVIEGDLLPELASAEDRRRVAAALAAPLTTLYVPEQPLHIVVLSLSQNSEIPLVSAPGSKLTARAGTGDLFDAKRFYTPELADRLRAFPGQFWVANDYTPQWREYLAAFLPWLAHDLGKDLKVARHREGDARYFGVPADAKPDAFIDGLSNSRGGDFGVGLHLVRIQRQPLPLLVQTVLGALMETPTNANFVTVATAIWLQSQQQPLGTRSAQD